MTRKRVFLTLVEKLWIKKCQADNENIKQTKIALDFTAKFHRPVIAAAAEEIEEEIFQKTIYGLDQMCIDDEVPIDDEVCETESLTENDDVEWVELVKIPDERLEKQKVQRKISDYFSAR